MIKYVVIYDNERKDTLPQDLLKGHVDHLKSLRNQGILLLCGPLKENNLYVGKGLLLFEANSKEEVREHVLKDPFISKKWYSDYRIYEWVEANDGNNYLMN